MGSESNVAKEMESLSLKKGDLIPGNPHERIVRKLGTGGCATVYLTWCEQFEEYHAVKFLTHGTAESRALFVAEMKVGAKLRDENIARILSPGETSDESRTPYFIMEYLDGIGLRQMLGINKKIGRKFEPIWVLELAVGIFDGLTAAHALKIIHRDLKPENIYVVKLPNNKWIPKLLDWGSYGIAGHREIRGTVVVYRGTPIYSAPEQFEAHEGVYEQTDIYSVGVILYELLAFRTPFVGKGTKEDHTILGRAHVFEAPKPIRELVPELPEEFAALIDSLLAKKIEDRGRGTVKSANDPRPITAEDVAKKLRELLAKYNEESVVTQMRTFENVEVALPKHAEQSTASTSTFIRGPRFEDVAVTDLDTPEWLEQLRAEAAAEDLGREPEAFIPATPDEVAMVNHLQRDAVASLRSSEERLNSEERRTSEERVISVEAESTERRALRQAATRTAPARRMVSLDAEAVAPPAPRRRATEVITLDGVPPTPKPLTKPVEGEDSPLRVDSVRVPEDRSPNSVAVVAEPKAIVPAAESSSEDVFQESPLEASEKVAKIERDASPARRRPRIANIWRQLTEGWAGVIVSGAFFALLAAFLILRTWDWYQSDIAATKDAPPPSIATVAPLHRDVPAAGPIPVTVAPTDSAVPSTAAAPAPASAPVVPASVTPVPPAPATSVAPARAASTATIATEAPSAKPARTVSPKPSSAPKPAQRSPKLDVTSDWLEK